MTEKINAAQKSILITGCSSGIGHASALALAQTGFTVFAGVRKVQDAQRINDRGLSSLKPVCPLDLTSLEQISAAAEMVKAELQQLGQSGLYGLIHNAGGGSVAPVELMDLDAFSRELQTRLVGAVALLQALLPLLRQGNGRIVWIVTPAIIPTPYVASIHACDFAANCLARTLDIELKSWGIPNIQVRCGGIKTQKGLQTTAEAEAILTHPRADLYRAQMRKWAQEMAAFDKRRTEPQEVARVVVDALLAPRPRRRYAVGYMSGAAAALEALPQPLADSILKARF